MQSVNEDITINDSAETQKTWDKFATSAKKAGYRDGVSYGRDQIFQKSFNEGYMEGLKNGLAIGKYKGVLHCADKNVQEVHLQHSKRGWCQICLNNDFTSSTEEIINRQNEHSNGLLKDLSYKYSHKTNVNLPKNLEM